MVAAAGPPRATLDARSHVEGTAGEVEGDVDVKIRVSQAYLEMAGAFLHAEVVPAEGAKTRDMPSELTYALVASNYQNAFLAVTSFLTAQITSCFHSDPEFRASFNTQNLEEVVRTRASRFHRSSEGDVTRTSSR